MDAGVVPEEAALSRAALAKIGWRVLPLLGLGYCLSYIDRVNIGFAAAQMNADLGFGAAVYGFGGGLFFLVYALAEVPSNLALERFGARLWIGRIMLTWGLLSAAMLLVRTPMQFYGMRMLLGAAEAGFFPGVIVYLSRWYPMANRSRAVSAFYVAVPLASVVMGSLAGLFLGFDGHFGLRGWQWLFLLEGLPAALLSLVIFWKLPESLHRVSWLSGPEKGAIQARLDRDVAHHDPHEVTSVFRAMVHPLVLVVGLVNFLFLGTTYAFTLSGPQILGHLTGFNPAQVGYLTAAGGLSGAAAMILNAWHSDHTGERFGHLIAPMLLIGAGFAALALSASPAMAIAGYLATMIGNSAFNGVFFATFSGLLSPAKLVVGVAAANMIGQLGSFFLPSLFGLVRQGAPGDAGAGLAYLPFPFLLAAAVLLGLAMTLSRRKAGQPAAA